MNTTQLRKLGVPDDCLTVAIQAIQAAVSTGGYKGREMKSVMAQVIARPAEHTGDPYFGRLATSLIDREQDIPHEPISYQTWGSDIDDAAHAQMRQSCALPMAVGAALMPDAHVGYGLPIGGVLALDNAVVPYAVGVDIACRMKLSVLDTPPALLDKNFHWFKTALEKGTRFGVGSEHEPPQDHPVMDEDWTITRITREHKDKARR